MPLLILGQNLKLKASISCEILWWLPGAEKSQLHLYTFLCWCLYTWRYQYESTFSLINASWKLPCTDVHPSVVLAHCTFNMISFNHHICISIFYLNSRTWMFLYPGSPSNTFWIYFEGKKILTQISSALLLVVKKARSIFNSF